MDRCLLDSSALSDVIQPQSKLRPNVAKHLKRYVRAHGRCTFSEMSCYEILRGLRKKGATKQLRDFVTFCGHSELIPVDFGVLDRAATVWSEGQEIGVTIGDSDIVIAATALVHGLPLITANTRHFSWIPGLRLVNWREP